MLKSYASMKELLARYGRRLDSGATAVEYGLVASVIAIVIFTGATLVAAGLPSVL